jgi:hypothetical protein
VRCSRLLAGALVALALALPAAAGPLAPSKPSQLVTARVVSTNCPLTEPVPNASANAIDEMSTLGGLQQALVIPPKQVLVITSVTFVAVGPPGEIYGMNLIAVNGQEHAMLAQEVVEVIGEGLGTKTIVLPTGIAVREGNALCMVASEGGEPFGSVTGFFAKDK